MEVTVDGCIISFICMSMCASGLKIRVCLEAEDSYLVVRGYMDVHVYIYETHLIDVSHIHVCIYIHMVDVVDKFIICIYVCMYRRPQDVCVPGGRGLQAHTNSSWLYVCIHIHI